jgi:NADH dehydrogenase
MTQTKIATVFGGTGFIGSQVVRELAKAGYAVKVATRLPERAYDLKPCGTVGQVVPIACDYSPDSISSAVRGSCVVVNLIGALFEKGKTKFERVHVTIPKLIAEACAAQKIERFVHVSSLGVHSTSHYGISKKGGEAAIKAAFPAATILRPSVVFGAGDHFFNMFAELARFAPALPLIGGGATKFQPVYVGDVADAVMAAINRPDAQGKIYELGGPEIVTFRQIYEKMFAVTGRKRCLVSLPWGLAKVQATFMSLLPSPLLTPDQVEALKTDTIVTDGALTFADLGLTPTAMDLILPAYLETYRAGGKFGIKT